jgi:hypothetical protein
MKMIPSVPFFFAGAHDWRAQPIFAAKKLLHVGDNVIAVVVYNGVMQAVLPSCCRLADLN